MLGIFSYREVKYFPIVNIIHFLCTILIVVRIMVRIFFRSKSGKKWKSVTKNAKIFDEMGNFLLEKWWKKWKKVENLENLRNNASF